jgi:hypothetical protein
MLDHILFGCNDLDSGISLIEQKTGVRAEIGGVHPGRGTRNALLSLGDRHYLEIIAPDPAQGNVANPLSNLLRSLPAPRLVGWAAHPGNSEAFAARLKQAGISFTGPTAGSRARPDGRMLKWKTINLTDDHAGVLPFFIEWDRNATHPSKDAPMGCRLQRFALVDPDPAALTKVCQELQLDVVVENGEKSGLRTRIAGPKGQFDASS